MSALAPLLLAAALAAAMGATHWVPPNVPAAYTPWTPSAADDAKMLSNPNLLQKNKNHHKHKGKDGKMVVDKDTDDDDDFPKIHFHFRTPSYGGFKMDEGATILHTMLGKLADHDYLKFAAFVATNHSLSTKQKITDNLRSTLKNLQSGGTDYLLAAAGATYPDMPEPERRKRFAAMLSAAIAQSKQKQSPQLGAKPVAKNATRPVLNAAAAKPAAKVMQAAVKVPKHAALAKPALKIAKPAAKVAKAAAAKWSAGKPVIKPAATPAVTAQKSL